jgi:hypothetical protein
MKIRNRITKFATVAMVVAAMAVIGSTGTARAQHVRVFDGYTFAGVVPGQMLRFSIFNPNLPEQGSFRAQVLLYDEQGNVLARSQQVDLPSGEFRSFDFNRSDLSPAGDPETGRLQIRGHVQVFMGDGSVPLPPTLVSASMELVDARTGGTIVHTGYVGWVKISEEA